MGAENPVTPKAARLRERAGAGWAAGGPALKEPRLNIPLFFYPSSPLTFPFSIYLPMIVFSFVLAIIY